MRTISQLALVCLGVLIAAASVRGQAERARPELPPDTVWTDQAKDVVFSADVAMGTARMAEYPDIATAAGRVFAIWTEHIEGIDRIQFAEVTSGQPGEPRTISHSTSHACWPALAADTQGRVWAAWSAKKHERWRIFVRQVFPELEPAPIEMPSASPGPRADCFKPAIACTDERTFVAWMEVTPSTSQIVAGSVREGQPPGAPMVLSVGGLAYRPVLAARRDACWLAWDEVVDERQYEIFLAKLGADRPLEAMCVTREAALDAAAALALDAEGRVWLAWHSDRHKDRQWDIPKWPEVRCYDGASWRQPPVDVPGKQDDPRTEDQSFEFPTLCFDSAGGLWLFGRPSHGFNAVRFAGEGSSPVFRYPLPGWGGRGHTVRAVAVGDEIWTVRRDLQRIMLSRIAISGPRPAEPKLVALRDPTLPIVHPVAAPPDAFPDPVVPGTGSGAPESDPAGRSAMPRVLFGDVHMHTAHSDGMGTIDELYHRARHDYRYDFATVTDHDDFVGNRILPSEWAYMQAIADLHDDPPRFATLCAFEWTDARYPKGDGHKNVYYRGHGPMLWHTDPEVDDAPKLFARLEVAQGICFPHHIGWTGVNWETHNEAIQTNVEICSVHGAYEYRGNTPIAPRGDLEGHFVQDGLNKGLRFGLVAGSDAHGLAWHHGIARRRNPWTQGLTAVYAREPRREAIWDALANHRCYATSGPKVVIDFKVADQPPGSEVRLTEPPLITAWVIAPVRVDQLAIIRDGNAIFTSKEDAESARVRHTDLDWPASGEGKAYYYLRVTLQNGEVAWTSPVFATFAQGLSPGTASP